MTTSKENNDIEKTPSESDNSDEYCIKKDNTCSIIYFILGLIAVIFLLFYDIFIIGITAETSTTNETVSVFITGVFFFILGIFLDVCIIGYIHVINFKEKNFLLYENKINALVSLKLTTTKMLLCSIILSLYFSLRNFTIFFMIGVLLILSIYPISSIIILVFLVCKKSNNNIKYTSIQS